jgi:hypothetical protein
MPTGRRGGVVAAVWGVQGGRQRAAALLQAVIDIQTRHAMVSGNMKKRENIAKRGPLIWAQYELRLDQLDILFGFVLHAFKELSKRKKENFVKGLKLQKQVATAERLEKLLKLQALADPSREVWDDKFTQEFREREQRKTRDAFRSRTHTQYAEWVTDGMVSAEILFRVAVFEDFLKHLHAEALSANPKVFADASPKKQAAYGDIFSNSLASFVEQQICREVEELDREGMEKRLDYFSRHLGIDLGKHRNPLLEISEIRNKIAHGKPLEAITKDDTTLPLQGIQKSVAKTIRAAMKLAFDKAESKDHQRFLRK